MNTFIYVTTEEDKDALIARGYTLLRSDSSGGIFIFLKDGLEAFGLDDIDYVESDVLLF